jgi:hypothetical protein
LSFALLISSNLRKSVKALHASQALPLPSGLVRRAGFVEDIWLSSVKNRSAKQLMHLHRLPVVGCR